MNGDWSGSPSGVNLFQTSLKRFSTSPHSRAISLSQKHFGQMVNVYRGLSIYSSISLYGYIWINLAVHCPLAEWAGAIPYVNSETKPHPHNCFT